MARRRYVYRSSVTGQWVRADYAAAHPDTTTREQVGLLQAVAVRIALAVNGG